MSDRVH